MLYEQVDGSGSPHIRRDSYKTPLAPISEVRKVTFAARFVQDELDNSYTPVDVVQVKFIPRFNEYRKSERKSMWYSNEDIKTMKQRAFRDIDVRRAEIKMNQCRQPNQQKKYSLISEASNALYTTIAMFVQGYDTMHSALSFKNNTDNGAGCTVWAIPEESSTLERTF